MDMKKPMKKPMDGLKHGSGDDIVNLFHKDLDLESIDLNKVVNKVWGWEYWIVNCQFYCSKFLKIKKDHICSTHYHQKKHETFHILSGYVYMEYDSNFVDRTYWRMTTGDTIIIPPFTKHAFGGITDALMLEVSTQHFDDDSYRDNNSKHIPDGSEDWYNNSSKFVNKIDGGNPDA